MCMLILTFRTFVIMRALISIFDFLNFVLFLMKFIKFKPIIKFMKFDPPLHACHVSRIGSEF